jgi:putative intracellular protease/amidase
MKYLFLALILFSFSNLMVNAQARVPDQEKLNVAIMVFNGVQIIDYTGPYEVLGSWGRRKVFTVAETQDTITTAMGMKVVPNYSFENAPKIDVLILPGGGNIEVGANGRGVGAQLGNEKVIKWVQQNAASAKYVMSVCNGAFFLAKAGLLDGLPATTTSGFIPRLQEFSPTTKPVYDKRFVDNGKIITTAGLSSGIDGALHLVEKLDGPGWAKLIAISIEYNWQPDSDYTRASLADTKIPDAVYDPILSTATPLDFRGDKNSWQDKWSVKTTAAPEQILLDINKTWAAQPGWTNIKTSKKESSWKFTNKDGKNWNGWVTVETASDQNATLFVSFGITNERSAKSE